MKKAQLEQPFVIIFGVIVMAFLLILGGYVIRRSLTLSNSVEYNTFYNQLSKEAENCYNLDFGSTCDLSKIKVPGSLFEICFINIEEPINYKNLPGSLNQTIANSIRLNRKDNVFSIGINGQDKKSFFIDKLKPAGNPICYRLSSRKLNLLLENKGNHVEVRNA